MGVLNSFGDFLVTIQTLGTNISTMKTFLLIIMVLVIIIFVVTALSFLIVNNIKKKSVLNSSYLAKSNYKRRKVLYK